MRLVEEILGGEVLEQAFFLGSELERARLAVIGLRGGEEKFRSVLKVRFIWPICAQFFSSRFSRLTTLDG